MLPLGGHTGKRIEDTRLQAGASHPPSPAHQKGERLGEAESGADAPGQREAQKDQQIGLGPPGNRSQNGPFNPLEWARRQGHQKCAQILAHQDAQTAGRKAGAPP